MTGGEKELTREMVHHVIGKDILQAQRMSYNFQIVLNTDVDPKHFLEEHNYKPIIFNPVSYEAYLPRQSLVHVRKFFVKNLNEPDVVRERDLQAAFGGLATIHKIRLGYKKGNCLGYGQIHFYDPENKLPAGEKITKSIRGREVTLEPYEKDRGYKNIVTF